MLKCKISCLKYVYLSEVFNNHSRYYEYILLVSLSDIKIFLHPNICVGIGLLFGLLSLWELWFNSMANFGTVIFLSCGAVLHYFIWSLCCIEHLLNIALHAYFCTLCICTFCIFMCILISFNPLYIQFEALHKLTSS